MLQGCPPPRLFEPLSPLQGSCACARRDGSYVQVDLANNQLLPFRCRCFLFRHWTSSPRGRRRSLPSLVDTEAAPGHETSLYAALRVTYSLPIPHSALQCTFEHFGPPSTLLVCAFTAARGARTSISASSYMLGAIKRILTFLPPHLLLSLLLSPSSVPPNPISVSHSPLLNAPHQCTYHCSLFSPFSRAT
jgi:hypothetical protein